jgi:hypothetical protein
MNGLLRRLTRRRAATADEHPPRVAPAASEPVDDATVVSLEEGSPVSEEQRAREEELKRRRRDLPAGLDPEELEGGVAESARRSTLRRRIRYLRAAREVLLRDLGGFYYEIHRTARTSPDAGQRGILQTKAQRLHDIDEELRQLVARLGEEPTTTTVIREPGIGGTCPTCGELHGSDAAWCWHCGSPLTDRARALQEREVDETIAARQAAALEAERAAAAPPDGETTADQKTLAEYTSRKAAADEAAAASDAAAPAAADEATAAHEPAAAAAADAAAPAAPDEATAAHEASANGGDATTAELKPASDPVGEHRA